MSPIKQKLDRQCACAYCNGYVQFKPVICMEVVTNATYVPPFMELNQVLC